MKKQRPSSTTPNPHSSSTPSSASGASTPQGMACCSSCCRQLPLSEFYVSKKTQVPDRYCKECRKALSRLRYAGEKLAKEQEPRQRKQPIITQVEDPKERLALIISALHVIEEIREARQKRINARR